MMLYVSGLIFKFSERKDHPLMKLYLQFQPFSYWAAWILWNFLFTHFGLYFHILEASRGFEILLYLKFSTVGFVFALIIIFTFFLKSKKSRSKETPAAKEK
jgi:hypothetical protein